MYFEEIKFPILYKNYVERTNFTYNNKYNVVYSKPSDQSFLNENFEPIIDLKDNKSKFKIVIILMQFLIIILNFD